MRRDENYENYNMEVMDVTDSERDINILENELSDEEEVELNAYGSPVRANRGTRNTERANTTVIAGPSASDNIDRVVRYKPTLCIM